MPRGHRNDAHILGNSAGHFAMIDYMLPVCIGVFAWA
jgi:hypothetical protein